MNIKNRITKLEEQTTTTGFCECKQTPKTEIYWQDLSSDFVEKNEPLLKGEPVPEFCPTCAREIEKQAFIIQLVDSDIPKPEEI